MRIPEFEDPNRWNGFIYIFLIVITGMFLLYLPNPDELASDRVRRRLGLHDTLGDARDHHVDDDGKKRCEESCQCVVHTTVLLNLDNPDG